MTDGNRRAGSAWRSWLQRYRHLMVLAVVVALVVWLPRIHSSSPAQAAGQATVGGAPNGGGGGGAASGAPGAIGASSGTSGAGAAGGGESPGSGAAAPAGGAAPGQSSRVATSSVPGVDSAAALANPLCDPATHRMRVPSIYAAPCVAPWPSGADNGGSISTGVTGSRIELVFYFEPNSTSAPPTPAQTAQYEQDIVNTIRMFTDHYELWGRTIHMDFYQGTGTDETSQNADAVQIVDQYHPFLVTTIGTIGTSGVHTFDRTVAAHGVIDWAADLTHQDAQGQAGYRWGYNPDDMMYALETGEFVGKELAGHPARWAGDAVLKSQTRKFGLIYDDTVQGELGTLNATLGRYGGHLADSVTYDPTQDQAALAQNATTQIVRMKAEGVNNVILWADPSYTTLLTDAAASQNYAPEWTVTGWAEQDTTIEAGLYNQGEWAHAFGIGPVPPLQEPATNTEYVAMYQWQTGTTPPAGLETALVGAVYLFAKDFAAGVQDAGPDLTPATFRDAVFTLPPTGGRWCQPPPGCFTHEGASFGTSLAGYSGDKYVDNSDFALKWWDESHAGQDEVGLPSKGVWQIVNGGERFAPGQWAAGPPDVFDLSHSTPAYTSLPRADSPPSYPRPGPGAQPSVTH